MSVGMLYYYKAKNYTVNNCHSNWSIYINYKYSPSIVICVLYSQREYISILVSELRIHES